ncbi:MAG: carboxypeptidase-like regulatory domain-containing protein, partial [Flavobacteriales bacterium]|nr:carboxypeptidase-like regulatory domain-containing protein [Flavobacteriales bacterium]
MAVTFYFLRRLIHVRQFVNICFGLCLLCQPVLAFQLSGTVSDEGGQPIPFVSIYLENTTYGVASNPKGMYFLELENGTHRIVFQAVGFQKKIEVVTIRNGNATHDVTLKNEAVDLAEITVIENKRDLAMEIMRKVIDKRRDFLNAYGGHKCETYIKASLEKEFIDRKDSLLPGLLKRERLNFIESYGYSYYGPGGQVKEVKTAYRDLAEKKGATVQVEISTEGDRSGQRVEHNPYLFYTTIADGDFNFYQNLLNIPKLGEKPFISPLAATAPLSYKYTFEETFYEDGLQINKILVTPRNPEAALFRGYLYIVEDQW